MAVTVTLAVQLLDAGIVPPVTCPKLSVVLPAAGAHVGEPPHVNGFMGLYTEIGVVNRRDASADSIINEIREATTARHTALLADPPTDGNASHEHIFGGVPWTIRVLLRNRPLDVWMHEQDIRRAVGQPGGMDTAPARHTAEYLAESLGFVLGSLRESTEFGEAHDQPEATVD